MNPIYTRDQLEGKKLAELNAISPEGMASLTASPLKAVAQDKRSKQSWIDAILEKQPHPVKPKTCAGCPHFQSHDDGTNKGWCCLFDSFTRESHTMTQDCINSMETEEEQVDDYKK